MVFFWLAEFTNGSACVLEALAANMKEVILVGVREAEAVLESFNEDFVAFELHVSFREDFCCV